MKAFFYLVNKYKVNPYNEAMASNEQYPLPEKKGFTVYTKPNCGFCDKVKELLNNQTTQPVVFIDSSGFLQKNKYDFLLHIEKCAGVVHTTFPIVFHNSCFIGGYSETQQYLQS